VIHVEDGETAHVDVDLVADAKATDTLDEQSRHDVEARVLEIANEVIDNREWATEEYENYDEDYDEDFNERDYDEERDDG
jgi:hypothetical protein